MTFRVYPAPQTAPLSVPAGQTSATNDFAEVAASPDPNLGGKRQMWLRVATSGQTSASTLFLQADNGTPIQIPDPAQADLTDFSVLSDNSNVGYLAAVIWHKDVLPNVQEFEILIKDPVPAHQWRLQVRNNNPANDPAIEVTWVVADNLADVAQPWVAIQPPPLDALIGATVRGSALVANKGTGPAKVSAVAGALPSGLSLVTSLPTADIAPTASVPLLFSFTAPALPPAPNGITNATLTVSLIPDDSTASGTDPAAGHSKAFTVSAQTQQLQVVLLLDDSGSMGWDARGSTPADPGNRRWSELAGATTQFLGDLASFNAGRGSFGVARFPGDGAATSADIHIPQPITATATAAVAVQIQAITPTDNTPMGDGLQRVIAGTLSSAAYFADDAFSRKTQRRMLVLMSDGAHNSGTHLPTEFISPPSGSAATGTSLKDRMIQLFAIGYGLPGFSNVDHQLLATLAKGSFNYTPRNPAPGVVSPGDQTDPAISIYTVDREHFTPTDLAAAFKSILKAGLSSTGSSRDPAAVFQVGEDEARHDVLLTRYDGQTVFSLNWNSPFAGRLRLELLTPTCELITPDNAGTGHLQGVRYRSDTRFASYDIDPDFLANTANPGSPRYGTWTMVVTQPAIIEVGVVAEPALAAVTPTVYENYTFDVMSESSLLLRLFLGAPVHYAGDPIEVSAQLTAGGLPVTGASVVLSTTAPERSAANWLAGTIVPADALEQARQRLASQDSTPILVKALGAQIAGLGFGAGQRQSDLPMADPGRTGIYRATFTDTAVPEHHILYVTAHGVTPDGVEFQREAKIEVFVLVRPTAAASIVSVQHTGPGAATVTAFPRDGFRNVYLVDPLTTPGFGLVVQGGGVAGPLTSALDGSYTATVTWPAGADLSVGLQVDGIVVIPPVPFPVPDRLVFVDQVIAFAPGPDPAANQHSDPQAVLGTPIGKPAERFVALGARGSLTVGVSGQDILAVGGNDVMVFVTSQQPLRSYRVEAFSVPSRSWMSIGESIGVSQGFTLSAAGLDATRGIRIIDTSGAVLGPDRRPLSDPGTRIAAVGVRAVRPHRRFFGQWCWCCRWLRGLFDRDRVRDAGKE